MVKQGDDFMNCTHCEFSLPPLPYDYDALEPYIDSQTMHLHHDKHFKKYVDELNKLLNPCSQMHNWSLERLLKSICLFPKKMQTQIRNNGGGVFNHNFYFNIMTPESSGKPIGLLGEKIINEFSSFDNFKCKFKNKALNQFGSGYAWLVCNNCGKLKIISTCNQDSPISVNLKPILTVDVWEHAYYLKYKNERSEYLDNWFNVINWDLANKIYTNFL